MKTESKFNHEELHLQAVTIAKEYRRCETALIGIFQELEKRRTFECYQMPSLFAYATKVLGLSEATTCMLTAVMRASNKVPELKTAVENGMITLSNARRIAPVLCKDNKLELLEKAATLPLRKLEQELAKKFPDQPAITRVIPKSESLSRLEIDLPHSTIEKLKHVQEILAQKNQKHVDAVQALECALDDFLERHDPVEKATRAKRRAISAETKVKKSPVARPVEAVSTIQKMSPEHLALARKMGFKIPRAPIPAKEKYALVLKENWQCSFVYENGLRCESMRWLHVHHVRQVANGGSNSVANLRTLCAGHHKVVHRR